jgi:hypothetical protein
MLGIPIYLELTGYPQVDGYRHPIARMLWGWLLMLLALITMLACLGNRAQRVVALLASCVRHVHRGRWFITSDTS